MLETSRVRSSIGGRKFPLVLKGDSNYAPDFSSRILNGDRHRSLSIHSFGAGLYVSGPVFLQVHVWTGSRRCSASPAIPFPFGTH